MQFSRRHLRDTFRNACVLATIGISGCGNSCFIAFSNNGNGGAIIVAANPPPTCSLSRAMGSIHVVALPASTCGNCTAASRVEHLLVTVRSIQLRSMEDSNSPWLEVAPQLANEPRQMDLIGNSPPQILVENALVPAGSYRQVRLGFLPDSPTDGEHLTNRECGTGRQNCIAMGDGGVRPVFWPDNASEPRIVADGKFVVLPDATVELQVSLEPRQLFSSSASEPWVAQEVLGGRIRVIPQSRTPRPE